MADSTKCSSIEKATKDSSYQLQTQVGANGTNGITGSDEVFQMNCETCNRDGIEVAASAFCTSCVAYLCTTCLKYHGKFFPDHIYLEKDDIPNDVCTEKCKTHQNELIKFYCDNCDSFACFVCKMKEHKNNCTLKYLPDLVKDLKNGEDLKNLVSVCDRVSTNLENPSKMISKELIKITNEGNEAIKNEKDLAFAKFDHEILRMEERLEFPSRIEQKRVDTIAMKFKPLKSEIEQLSMKVRHLSKSPKSGKYKLFIEMKEKQRLLKGLENSIQDMKNAFTRREDELKLQTEDLKQRVKMFGKEIGDSTGNCSYLWDINVRTQDDENDCDITKCCLLSELFLIVCDKSNYMVKLVDTESQEVVSSRPVFRCPVAVTKISKTEVAVVQPTGEYNDKSVIQFLFLTKSNKLIFKKVKLHTESCCTDIVYINDGRLLISMSFNHCGKVQILNMEGEIFTTIEMNEQGDRLFIMPVSIALNREANRAYVSDWYSDSITTIDLIEQKLWNFSKSFWHPKGITTDDKGCIYVCDTGRNRIYVIYPDGPYCQVLLDATSENWCPRYICYSDTENKLYVVGAGSVIKVFKLKNSDVAKVK